MATLVQRVLMDSQVLQDRPVEWVIKVPMAQRVQWATPVLPACRVSRVRPAQSVQLELLVQQALQASLARPANQVQWVIKAALAQ